MQKKILSGILALSMLCGTAFMSACATSNSSAIKPSFPNNNQTQTPTTPNNPVTPPVDDRPVDTYEGYLSEEKYATAEMAASEYVTNELKGEATIGSLYDYTIDETELTEEEIAGLNLTSAIGNVSSVRKMRVQYVDKAYDDIKEKEIYLVAMTDGAYSYYVPNIVAGETLNKSYYDLVTSTTLAYTNVTCSMSNTEKTTTTIYGSTTTDNSTTTGTWKITADVAYFQGSTTSTQGTQATEYYVIRSSSDAETFIAVMRMDNSAWEIADYPLDFTFPTIKKADKNYLSAAISMVEFATADHSYFEKTNTGFHMSSDKLEAYSNNILLPIVTDTLNKNIGGYVDISQMVFTYSDDTFVDYYLKANTLNKYDYVSNCTCTYAAYNMVMSIESSGTVSYSNYGTTVVKVPDDVQNLVDNY